jgi:hypothetical protein
MNRPLSEEDALDQALTRAITAPALPAGFRARLHAALTRTTDADLAARRRMLEREYQELQQMLRSDSIRLRWWTLGSLVGGAFAAGIAVAVGMPWIRATFGANSDYVLLIAWAAVSVLVGGFSWVRRNGMPQWIP